MSRSRTNVALALENLDEQKIRTIAEDILSEIINKDKENLNHFLSIADESLKKRKISSYTLRGLTGKKAEQIFIKHYRFNNLPFGGDLIDKKDLGCGYDFKIESESEHYFIEIKVLASSISGILFTNKERETAKRERTKYTACIVSNINSTPKISFINDPYSKLNPRKSIIQTVQVQWAVSNNELKNAND